MSQKNRETELFLASVSFISSNSCVGFIDPGLKTTPDPPLSGLTIAGMPPPAQHLWLPPHTLSTLHPGLRYRAKLLTGDQLSWTMTKHWPGHQIWKIGKSLDNNK